MSQKQKSKLDDYLSFQRKVIDECVRVTRRGGSICWQVGHSLIGKQHVLPLDMALYPFFAYNEKLHGLRLRNRIIWHFEHGLHCKKRFSGRHETILWYTKGEDYVFNLDEVRIAQKYPGKRAYKGKKRGEYSGNPIGKNPGDVWIFPNVKGSHIEKTGHPCQFPVELPARFVLALSNRGDLVLDPFLGTGTMVVAAILFQRRAAGSDIKEEYIDIARKRIRDAYSRELPYRDVGKPVYIPPENSPLTTPPPGVSRRQPKG